MRCASAAPLALVAAEIVLFCDETVVPGEANQQEYLWAQVPRATKAESQFYGDRRLNSSAGPTNATR